ncbi:hypothetical protein HMPREF0083_05908 [Aneurinibacillus aneurinilyticus ATCC 12856]|uniref:Uncharacterized protein n=2 Tax=Aneurinibacillus aneurinilyticus TaxID=1391 RepID=U1Y1R2_ANEAE|nr:hypothetical protein HMPREF0083_05908 [Aneurinibacillus aneurinilyticus ATCC 12856]
MCVFGLLAYALDSRDKFKELRNNGIVYREQKPILVEENNGVYKVKNMVSAQYVMGGFTFIMMRDLKKARKVCKQ